MSNDNINNTNEISYKIDNEEQTVSLKSTEKNPIQKDDIEAKNIEIKNNGEEVQVETILKNNTNEKIEGFFIQIDLQNEAGETITTISEESKEVIEKNSEITLNNLVTGINNAMEIKKAEIVQIQKKTTRAEMEETFDEIEDVFEE